jgi:hypothetical protein
MLLLASTTLAATLTVGPSGAYATPCAAIAVAAAGDRIEVDAAGTYDGDSCAWSTDNLTVVGVNGRPRIDAAGATLSQQKGIFVIQAENATIENLELSGASVPDQNGAAIRHQGTNLNVVDCWLHDNENGILGSPATPGTGEVTIHNTELSYNGFGDGYSHNVYLGDYARVLFTANYAHHAVVGHLFKSRALENRVLYNRLADGVDGQASYELNLPNAGRAYVIGNLIQQAATSQNSALLSYGEETDGQHDDTALYVVNNTIVNDRSAGTFVSVDPSISTPATLWNNLVVGQGTLCTQASAALTANLVDPTGDGGLTDRAAFDYTLAAGAAAIDAGSDPPVVEGYDLEPNAQYRPDADSEDRGVAGTAIDVGAMEYGNPGLAGDTGGDTAVDPGDSAEEAGETEKTSTAGPCGCASAPAGSLAWIGAALLIARKRRSATLG